MSDLKLRITSSPHLLSRDSTARIMWTVSAALAPAALWGVFVFGWKCLIVLLASILSSLAAEAAVSHKSGKQTIQDGSAFLTGLLIGMNMPPEIPLYIPVIASLFAILVVKMTFGGLGNNWMNPALAGRVFVFFSWTGPMTKWKDAASAAPDSISGATVLGSVKSALADGSIPAEGPMGMLKSLGWKASAFDITVTDFINSVFSWTGLKLQNGYADLAFGNMGGCIGEVSAILLFLGGLYLVFRKIANANIVLSYFISFSVFIVLFGGIPYGSGIGSGNLLFHLLSGGFMLGCFFMATDMATSPLSAKGMLWYGAGIGFLTFLIRVFGSLPEGVSLAIILMNIASPFIDRYTQPRKFGIGPAAGAGVRGK